jgi:hypothetical protein
MGAEHRLYRALVHLYPGQFRRDYGEDLVQHFDDLVTDRGARAAWARTGLDLTITIPRYHLEQLMNDHRSSIALNLIIVALALGGVVTFLIGIGPSVVLLVAAGGLAITQRSALAQSLRVPDGGVRRRRLMTAAVLGAIFVVSYAVYAVTIGESWTVKDTVLALVGTVAMVGAVGYFIAGLATPRTPDDAHPVVR